MSGFGGCHLKINMGTNRVWLASERGWQQGTEGVTPDRAKHMHIRSGHLLKLWVIIEREKVGRVIDPQMATKVKVRCSGDKSSGDERSVDTKQLHRGNLRGVREKEE